MGKQKYFTEEERKAAKRESNKRYAQKNKERKAEYDVAYRKKNKKNIAERNAKYYEENKEKISEYGVKWRKKNKEKILARRQKYYQENREILIEKSSSYYQNHKEEKQKYDSERRSTPIGRAKYLVDNYRRKDSKTNKGECTLTPKWIVENIFSKPCHYCGKIDWKELGCDRIDNSKPHTEDNVVCCCGECNTKRGRKEYNEFIKIIKEKNI